MKKNKKLKFEYESANCSLMNLFVITIKLYVANTSEYF